MEALHPRPVRDQARAAAGRAAGVDDAHAHVIRSRSGISLIALAIVVGGAVAAFAIYTFGWHDRGRRQRVYTLRDGDVVLRPEAATRCVASAEGGFPDLFCTRIGGGRHQVVFYRDDVLVWPLAAGPDAAPFSYRWEPTRRKTKTPSRATTTRQP
jgi:hypothetical protein